MSNQKFIDYNFLVDDISNIDNYKIFIKTGDFENDNIPDRRYLSTELSPLVKNGRFVPTETGVYYFRVYSYNAKNNIYSAGYASGVVSIYGFDPVKEISISSLKVEDLNYPYTGNALNRYVTFVKDNDANPTFVWQVAYGDVQNVNNINYRATVRPYNASFGRIPMNPVLYEETGISTERWTFDVVKNINSSGGPYREYQVVIEAYDENGLTSAGNRIGYIDNSFHAYPFGYDLISIENPRQTGIELQDNIPTYVTGIFISGTGSFLTHPARDNTSIMTGNQNYQNNIYIGPNGNLIIEYTSGQFDADLKGGYVYVSKDQFPKTEARENVGYWGSAVKKSRFTFDPQNPIITHPTAASNLKYYPSGYIAVSFYDEVDEILINSGVNVSTGLYVSNIAIAAKSIDVSSISYGTPSGTEISFCTTIYYESEGTNIDFSQLMILSSGQLGDLIVVQHSCPNSSETSWQYSAWYGEDQSYSPGYDLTIGGIQYKWYGGYFKTYTGISITHIGAPSFEAYYGAAPIGPEFARPIKLIVSGTQYQGTWPVVANGKYGWYELSSPVVLPSGAEFKIVRYEETGDIDGSILDQVGYAAGTNYSGEHIETVGSYAWHYISGFDNVYTGIGGNINGPVGFRYDVI